MKIMERAPDFLAELTLLQYNAIEIGARLGLDVKRGDGDASRLRSEGGGLLGLLEVWQLAVRPGSAKGSCERTSFVASWSQEVGCES